MHGSAVPNVSCLKTTLFNMTAVYQDLQTGSCIPRHPDSSSRIMKTSARNDVCNPFSTGDSLWCVNFFYDTSLFGRTVVKKNCSKFKIQKVMLQNTEEIFWLLMKLCAIE